MTIELRKGKSPSIIEHNIGLLVGEGFTQDEAAQIAYSKAGKKLPIKVYRTHQFERASRNQTRQYQE